MINPTHPANEFSRPQAVEKIPPRGMTLNISATPEECAAVAARLGLLSIGQLQAELTIRYESSAYHVTGALQAAVTQQCVVTLTPLPAKLNEPVAGTFMAPELIPAAPGSEDVTDALDDIIEPLVNGSIDLGELVVQHLALALDPYPRKEGAEITLPPAVAEANQRLNPFAVLASLKTDQKK